MKYLVLVLSLVVSIDTKAYETNIEKIDILRSSDGRPCTFFTLKNNTKAGETDLAWYVLNFNHADFKNMFSMLLAAKMAQTNVNVHTAGKDPECSDHARVVVLELM